MVVDALGLAIGFIIMFTVIAVWCILGIHIGPYVVRWISDLHHAVGERMMEAVWLDPRRWADHREQL